MGIVAIVILVIAFSGPKLLGLAQVGYYGMLQQLLDTLDHFLCGVALRRRFIKNCRGILRANIRTVAGWSGGLVRGKEDGQEGFKWHRVRSKLHAHHFDMAGTPPAIFFIAGMLDVPATVTGLHVK